MKKISRKVAAMISVPLGALLATLSSCSHRNTVKDAPCVYGPPVEIMKPRPLVYGPRPVMEKRDSISKDIIKNEDNER